MIYYFRFKTNAGDVYEICQEGEVFPIHGGLNRVKIGGFVFSFISQNMMCRPASSEVEITLQPDGSISHTNLIDANWCEMK